MKSLVVGLAAALVRLREATKNVTSRCAAQSVERHGVHARTLNMHHSEGDWPYILQRVRKIKHSNPVYHDTDDRLTC